MRSVGFRNKDPDMGHKSPYLVQLDIEFTIRSESFSMKGTTKANRFILLVSVVTPNWPNAADSISLR